jgi:hypothetical protein
MMSVVGEHLRKKLAATGCGKAIVELYSSEIKPEIQIPIPSGGND